MKHFLLGLSLIALSACGTNMKVAGGYLFEAEDLQNRAGLFALSYKLCENKLGGFELCNGDLYDGKEQGTVKFDWDVNQDGVFKMNYEASDIRAFQAFDTRAKLQEALGAQVTDAMWEAFKLANPSILGGN